MSNPEQKPRTYDHWFSTTNKPFQPVFDEEARKRAAAVAWLTLSAGGNGLDTLTNYMVGRVAAGTPIPQAADLSKLGKNEGQISPEDLVALIDGLFGQGTKNKGVVFGIDHNKGIHEAFADPKVIAAMKKYDIFLCLEMSPDTLKATRNPSGDLAKLSSYDLIEHFLTRNRARTRVIRQCDATDIAIVPMDCQGPCGVQDMSSLRKVMTDPDKAAEHLKAFTDNAHDSSTERHRITGQVWVPRIKEAMKDNPKGRFIVLAGDGHICNPSDITIPDIGYSDLNEDLAREFKAPIPYIRMLQKDTDQVRVYAPKGNEKKGFSERGLDTPHLYMEVPSGYRQEIRNMAAFKDKSEAIRQHAAKQLEGYDEQSFSLVMEHIAVLERLKRKPAKEDIAAIDALVEARQLTLKDKYAAAEEALKPVKTMMAGLMEAGGKKDIQSQCESMEEKLGILRDHIRNLDPSRYDHASSKAPSSHGLQSLDWNDVSKGDNRIGDLDSDLIKRLPSVLPKPKGQPGFEH